MLPIGRATFEFEEFLAACEYDRGCSPDTASFYRKKVTHFLSWAQQAKAGVLDAQLCASSSAGLRTRASVTLPVAG